MSTPVSKNNSGIRTRSFVVAAALLTILIVVLFLLSGALNSESGKSGEEEITSIVEETETVRETPTPTPTPVFQVYVTCSTGGDAFATSNAIKQGESDHITIIPDFGWTVGSVTINGVPSSYSSSFDLTEIRADTVIHVEFVAPETVSDELEPDLREQEDQ